MRNCNLELNLIARQYTERGKFSNYDRAIKQLECHHIHSFTSWSSENGIFDSDVPVYTCKFSSLKSDYNSLAIANENGIVCLENISKKNQRTYVQTHNNTVFDLAWVPGEKKFVTVSGDHSAKLWDCGESDIRVVSEFLGHTRSVKCVHFKLENTAVFATGSRDGSLILWDTRSSTKCSRIPSTQHPDQVIHSPCNLRKKPSIEASQSNSVTGVLFQNDNTLISSGSYDQFIRVWDMRRTYSRTMLSPLPKYQLSAPSTGFSHLCINALGTKLYANCMDSYIYCFNVNSYDPDPTFYGHRNESFYVKSSLSHDGYYLMSGSSDKLAYIWNTTDAELFENAVKPLVTLPGHTAEVACVSMSFSGNMKVVSCSDDGTYRLWYPFKLEKPAEIEVTRDIASTVESLSSDTVRTRWRNKRKLSVEDKADSPAAKMLADSHTKICRFYNSQLPISACVCQQSISGVKRSLCETDPEVLRIKKRCSDFEIQERTPPKFAELNQTKVTPVNNCGSSHRQTFVRTSSKRKLADMPNFIEEENRSRKLHCSRVLSPITERAENCQDEHELDGVGIITEYQDSVFENILSECKALATDGTEIKNDMPEFSSPTTNLPNYVRDGTSPYLHRCPRLSTQKENIDWLTRLRKENVKEASKITPEEKKTTSKIMTPNSLEKLSGVKRRLAKVRSSPVDSKNPDQTLHKYFKISSKPAEIAVEAQKKM